MATAHCLLVIPCCPLNLHFHPFICCVWFALRVSGWLAAYFRAGGKILSVWSGREKYGQHNRISSLVSALLPCGDIPMGTRFLLCKITVGSVRAVSYLDMKDRKMEERGVKRGEKGRRGRTPRGIMMPEIHWAPSWKEVIIISWPSITLVLIAFQEEVILCSAVYSQSVIVCVCMPVCCCVFTAIWSFFLSYMVRIKPLKV